MKILKHFFRRCLWIYNRFFEAECLSRSAALTYTTLLSVVPLVVVVLAVLNHFNLLGDWSPRLESFIFSNFVPSTGQIVQSYVRKFSEEAGSLPLSGLLFLSFTAVMLMISIERHSNAVWQAPKHRALSASVLIYWTLLALGPILVVLSLVISSYLISLGFWQGLLSGIDDTYLMASLPIMTEFLGFVIIYAWTPCATVKILGAILGGLLATGLFEVAKYFFAYYVIYFSSYTLLYGALATIPLFLIWMYCVWVIFFLGLLAVKAYHLTLDEL